MYLYIAIFLGALFVFVNGQTFKKPVVSEGVLHLKFHPVFGLIGIGVMVFAFVPPIYSFFLQDYSTPALSIMTGMFLFFFAMGLLLFIWYKKHHVLYDDSIIIVYSLMGKKKQFTWKDIKGFRLNHFSGRYTLTLVSGEKVTINQNLMGINDFLNKVKETIAPQHLL